MTKALPADYYGTPPGSANVPEPDPADVSSPEAIIAASYESISGPAGQPRDWKRQDSLFLPESRCIRTGKLPDGTTCCKVMNNEEYKNQMESWLVENGFFETEIHRTVERFGNIAHVFSTYESRRNKDDAAPFMRGINSFQLLFDGRRWWIINIMWQHESPEFPIPDKYL